MTVDDRRYSSKSMNTYDCSVVKHTHMLISECAPLSPYRLIICNVAASQLRVLWGETWLDWVYREHFTKFYQISGPNRIIDANTVCLVTCTSGGQLGYVPQTHTHAHTPDVKQTQFQHLPFNRHHAAHTKSNHVSHIRNHQHCRLKHTYIYQQRAFVCVCACACARMCAAVLR